MKTPLQTMEAANIGSAHASMRRASAPCVMMSSTGDMTAISSGAKIHISTPMAVMTPMPRATDRLANERVSRRCPAPTLCPTSVVAASAMP